MAITFVCRCGKRLRAREDMASRRSMCPACGEPVGVPSLQGANADGRAGPMSPEELSRRRSRVSPDTADTSTLGPASVRMRPRDPARSVGSDWRPLDGMLVAPPGTKPEEMVKKGRLHRRRRKWALEGAWHHCLLYPFRAWSVVVALSVLLASLTALTTHLLPHLHEMGGAGRGWAPGLLLLLPLTVVALTASFLDFVACNAAAGEYWEPPWPGKDLASLLYAGSRWLACLVAGPILVVLLASWFWLNCGDPAWVDYLILAELVVIAVCWWLLALFSYFDAGGLSGLWPSRVLALAFRLKWRMFAVLAAPLVAGASGWVAMTAIEEAHRDPAPGLMKLVAAWLTLLFAGTFLLRLIGVACYRSRIEDVVSEPEGPQHGTTGDTQLSGHVSP